MKAEAAVKTLGGQEALSELANFLTKEGQYQSQSIWSSAPNKKVWFCFFFFFFFFFLLGIYSRLFSAAEAVWLLFFCSIQSKPGTVSRVFSYPF